MPQPRSPGYPRMPLRAVIGRVQKVKDLHSRSAIDRDTACRAMGYSTDRSGGAARALGAAIAYNLLEIREPGKVGVTEDAMVVFVGQDPERSDALRRIVSAPPVHQTIADAFTGDVAPSEQAIAGELELNHNFSAQASVEAARGYIEAHRYASQEIVSTGDGDSGDAGPTMVMQPEGGTTMTAKTQTRLSGPLPDGDHFYLNTSAPLTAAVLHHLKAVIEMNLSVVDAQPLLPEGSGVEEGIAK